MITTLLIFDVDGTLIRTKAGRRAFNRAFEGMWGLVGAAERVDMAGRTDPAIFAEICDHYGLESSQFDAWKCAFLVELESALAVDPSELLPGVRSLVEACSAEPGFVLVLGTGNVEEGARLKLSMHGLNGFFPTGGFGGDGAVRHDVIAAAIRRAAALAGHEFDRIVVLGDTQHDIECGRSNQCFSVGVATGPVPFETLAECRPDLVFPSFADALGVLQKIRQLK